MAASLVKCHVGCTAEQIVAALGLKMVDLFPPRPKLRLVSDSTRGGGVTLAQYAEAKGLPEQFLADLGLLDVPYSALPRSRSVLRGGRHGRSDPIPAPAGEVA